MPEKKKKTFKQGKAVVVRKKEYTQHKHQLIGKGKKGRGI